MVLHDCLDEAKVSVERSKTTGLPEDDVVVDTKLTMRAACLQDDLSVALPAFSRKRGPEAAALVQLQQYVSFNTTNCICILSRLSTAMTSAITITTTVLITSSSTTAADGRTLLAPASYRRTLGCWLADRGFDGDPRTIKGALTFLVPIILDGIFNKFLPQVFAPNGIRMLQVRRGWSYGSVCC